jgi:signal peptidase II
MGVSQARTLWLGTFLFTIVLDQVIKALTRVYIPLGGHGPDLIPRILGIRHAENYGVAFGQLQGWGVYLAPIAIVIAYLAFRHSWKHPQESVWSHVAMGLLASGAIGNMIDRLARGKVTDMFEFQFVSFPVFNIADACISVAAAILLFVWGRAEKTAEPEVAQVPPSTG